MLRSLSATKDLSCTDLAASLLCGDCRKRHVTQTGARPAPGETTCSSDCSLTGLPLIALQSGTAGLSCSPLETIVRPAARGWSLSFVSSDQRAGTRLIYVQEGEAGKRQAGKCRQETGQKYGRESLAAHECTEGARHICRRPLSQVKMRGIDT
jgi:hypothetical protein